MAIKVIDMSKIKLECSKKDKKLASKNEANLKRPFACTITCLHIAEIHNGTGHFTL